jgi:hypothetical protein
VGGASGAGGGAASGADVGGGAGSGTGVGAGGSCRRRPGRAGPVAGEGRPPCTTRCSGRRDGFARRFEAPPSAAFVRRRTPLPDTIRPSCRELARRSSGAGAATRGSPTSAGTGGGAGGFSSFGTSCKASSPTITIAAPFPAALQRIRSAIQPYKPISQENSPPSFQEIVELRELLGGRVGCPSERLVLFRPSASARDASRPAKKLREEGHPTRPTPPPPAAPRCPAAGRRPNPPDSASR